MKRKKILSLVSGLMIAAGFVRAETPNVIVIYCDDLGYGDVGCYGADTNMIQTPNIDSLASAGRRFTDAHSASAVCTPSRYALLTGEYPFRDNHYSPIFLKDNLIIPEETVTIADLMKNAGYATGIIGKWHMGFQDSYPVDWNAELKPGPLELGFDYYYGVPTVNSHPPFVYVENHHVVGHVYDTNSVDYEPFDYDLGAGDQGYTAEIDEKMKINDIGGSQAAHALYDDYEVGLTLAGKAVDWIDANKDEPFFLILATTHIHHPFTPAAQFQGTSGCGLYGDFIHELDYVVGQLLQKLEDEGLTDDTLVIFTADNGGMLNVTGQEAWELGHHMNGELLGFKSDGWEGGHRVPFIAKWPGHIPANTVSDQLISGVDMLATMAALTEIKISDEVSPDGVNILQALVSEPEDQIREHLVCMPYRSTFLALRSGDWAYLDGQGSAGWNAYEGSHTCSGPKSLPFTGYMNDSYTVSGTTVSLNADAPEKQLYNLADDLAQTTNLYDEETAVAEELDEILALIEAGTAASSSASNTVNWTIHSITTSESDVVTTGTTHTAVNNCATAYASANPTIVVNGVSFSSTGAELSDDYGGDGWTAAGVDSEYDQLLSTVDFENSGTGWFSVHTFTNLTVGREYLLQVWYAASAQPRSMTLKSFDEDGAGDVTLSGLEYAVGQFTAESTEHELMLQASANGPRVNGYQLRALPYTPATNVVSWTTYSITTNASDVITTGTTHTAVNNCSTAYASANPALVVNGVSFASTGAELSDNYAGDSWTAAGVDSEYDKLLSTVDFENSGTGGFTVHTFNNLTLGHDYLLQVWYAASAQPRSMTLESFDKDGAGDVTLSGLEYAVGRFTAESTEHELVLQASANGPRMTGYQLRDLSYVPSAEPGEDDAVFLSGFALEDSLASVRFSGTLGSGYQVQFLENLSSTGEWNQVEEIASLSMTPWRLSLTATNSCGFWRIKGTSSE